MSRVVHHTKRNHSVCMLIEPPHERNTHAQAPTNVFCVCLCVRVCCVHNLSKSNTARLTYGRPPHLHHHQRTLCVGRCCDVTTSSSPQPATYVTYMSMRLVYVMCMYVCYLIPNTHMHISCTRHARSQRNNTHRQQTRRREL